MLAAFHDAITEGDRDNVRAMASKSPSLVHSTDPRSFGSTPLLRAVGRDDPGMVDLLLELGADINQKSDWWAGGFGVLDDSSASMSKHLMDRGVTITPHAAARLGLFDQLQAMIRADVLIVHARGGDGQLPLHFARSSQIADLLLEHGAAIDAIDVDHASTAAQWLADLRPRVASHLVSKGAAPDPFLAARVADTRLLESLVPHESEGIGVRISRERFCVSAPAAGHIYLYTIGEGATLAHAAAGARAHAGEAEEDQGARANAASADVIRWLAGQGADLNARGGYDQATPLHVAAWADNPAAAGALVDAGAAIDAPSGRLHHNEPLGWAIVAGSLETARLLKERGAAVKPHHRSDARRGAAGEFRHFNPRRPLARWTHIEQLLGAA